LGVRKPGPFWKQVKAKLMDLPLAFHIKYCDFKKSHHKLHFTIKKFKHLEKSIHAPQLYTLNILQIKLTQISEHSGNAACYTYIPGTSVRVRVRNRVKL
jgi:hypothetical protein